MRFAEMGNMTIAEIDKLMALLQAKKKEGHFSGMWRTAAESATWTISVPS